MSSTKWQPASGTSTAAGSRISEDTQRSSSRVPSNWYRLHSRIMRIASLSSGLFLYLITAAVAFSQALSNSTSVPRVLNAAEYESIRSAKVAHAVRTPGKITLDGRLDEPEWALAEPATDFVEQQPHIGELSPEQTQVRFLYDNNNLYVGVVVHDSGNPVVNGITYDFSSTESDNINIVIDSLHDQRSGFSFTTNPAGGKRDQQLSNDGQGNLDWY